jgi:hypothetical protein
LIPIRSLIVVKLSIHLKYCPVLWSLPSICSPWFVLKRVWTRCFFSSGLTPSGTSRRDQRNGRFPCTSSPMRCWTWTLHLRWLTCTR